MNINNCIEKFIVLKDTYLQAKKVNRYNENEIIEPSTNLLLKAGTTLTMTDGIFNPIFCNPLEKNILVENKSSYLIGSINDSPINTIIPILSEYKQKVDDYIEIINYMNSIKQKMTVLKDQLEQNKTFYNKVKICDMKSTIIGLEASYNFYQKEIKLYSNQLYSDYLNQIKEIKIDIEIPHKDDYLLNDER